MKKVLLLASAVAVMGLVFLISGCGTTTHEDRKEAVELAEAGTSLITSGGG